MLAHLLTYLEAIIGYWFTGFWFLTAVPEALSYVLPDTTFATAGRWIDSWITEQSRQKLFRWLAVFGFLMAAFLAWDEQYEKGQTDWPVLTSTEMAEWSRELSPFKSTVGPDKDVVPIVTIWYVPRDEDVAVTIAKALKDAQWQVVEIRESNPIVGFSIDANKQVEPAAKSLQSLCEKKFGVSPEMPVQRYPYKIGEIVFTIGRRVP